MLTNTIVRFTRTPLRQARLLFRSHSTEAGSAAEVVLTRHTGDDTGILTLTLNRSRAKNAISRKLLAELRQALGQIRGDTDARVVVLRSAVAGVFCAGADLKERATMDAAEVRQFLEGLKAALVELEGLPQPTVAALDGAALGGGLELALCCDLRVAGRRAVVGLPETSLGIIPGAGGTVRLARLVGAARAKALVFTARRLQGAQAQQWGVVDDVATGDAEEAAYERALEWAREILPNAPVAVRMAKRAIDHAATAHPAAALDIEQLCYAQVLSTEDRLEGLRAFKEKRKPVYRGC
ncbi:hypothetical protein GGI07_004673 [Coemansia sp. Benny D115]|nr:hypothetical protein GGI07_004673 [Coemansia sp. Benny D115]